MVFDSAAAPRGREAFMGWYRQQTRWTEPHGYNNPDIPAAPLRAWFREIIQTFPPMNGPLASDDIDNPKVTEYALGRSVIYAALSWPQAQAAYEHVKRLAATHGVGFFDTSSSEGAIWFPTPDGDLERSDA